ncbi:hypothetical protein [Nocardioides sp.]|uniref:hypothetical protein n=1 Tax=Nocardioides sp. TaxID=35761 RepID=UPI003D13F020
MRLSAATALLLALGGLAACTGSGDGPKDDGAERPAGTPTPSATPLAGFDTASVVVARDDFCSLVPELAVEQTLGGPFASTTDYVNGERAPITPKVRDVAHEYSCTWVAEDGTTARAWVFAPPVTPKAARGLVRDLRDQRRCDTPDAPDFGTPSVATVCTSDTGLEAAFHGLFVDAWLSCSLTGAPGTGSALLDRTGQWCVQVAQSIDQASQSS